MSGPALREWLARSGLTVFSLGILAASAHAGPRLAGIDWAESVAVQTNGLLEPGESGRLSVRVRNDSGAPLVGLAGTLRVVAPGSGVDLLGPSTRWPDLPAGGVAVDDGGLELRASPGLACGTVIELELDLLAGAAPVGTLSFVLSVGRSRDVSVDDLPDLASGHQPALAWNGENLGVAVQRWDPSGTWIEFQLFDSAGVPQGPAQVLSGVGYNRNARVTAGPDRWCVTWVDERFVNAHDAWQATLTADGSLLTVTRLHAAEADFFGASPPSAAWDGAGFGIVHQADRRDFPAASARELTYWHLDASGNVDQGPVRIDTGLVPARWWQPLIWTGREHAVLAYSEDESALLRIASDGRLLGRGPTLPGAGRRFYAPALVWTGWGFGLLPAEVQPQLWILEADGALHSGPHAFAAGTSALNQAWFPAEHALTWDGSGFGLALSLVDVAGSDEFHAIGFARLDRRGRRWHPGRLLTPLVTDHFARLVPGATWNAEAGEHWLPIVEVDGWGGAPLTWTGTGGLRLLRLSPLAFCAEGEAPREVSGPGAARLRAEKEWTLAAPGGAESWFVTLRFEDLGVEAEAYGWTVARETIRAGVPRALPVVYPTCGAVPESGSFVFRPDGPGLLYLLVDGALPTLVDPQSRRLTTYFVTAANAWGEGSLGRDSLGRPREPPLACGPSP